MTGGSPVTRGLTDEQREHVNTILARPRRHVRDSRRKIGDRPLEAWWLCRVPSVLSPPTELRLRYRDETGMILFEYVITEKRVTHEPRRIGGQYGGINGNSDEQGEVEAHDRRT
jgi:hypothetical protein